MADKRIPMRRLRRILRAHGVEFDESRGKGSHGIFSGVVEGKRRVFPVPKMKDVPVQYVRSVRRRFQPTEEDGVTDREFYDGE